MFNYNQHLREAMLKGDDPPQKKADNLNLLEMIFSGEMSVDEMVNAIGNGEVPVVYKVLTNEPEGEGE